MANTRTFRYEFFDDSDKNMPSMPNTDIAPALTPDEWATRNPVRERMSARAWNVAGETGITVEDGCDPCTIEGASELHAVIALANAALPDDDRRKIRRADVQWLEELVGRLEHTDFPSYMTAAARALAAKLAALLPPDA